MKLADIRKLAQLVSDMMYWNACEACGAIGAHCQEHYMHPVDVAEREQMTCTVTGLVVDKYDEVFASDMKWNAAGKYWSPPDSRLPEGVEEANDDG